MSANDVTQTTPNAIIQQHANTPGGLLPALHALQHHEGFVDRAHFDALADAFNISVAEVHGVVSFYKDFRTTPPTGALVQVCRGEACQARGGRRVWDAARTAPEWAEVEVEEVFCLGHCAAGPNVMVHGDIVPLRDEGDLEAVTRRAEAGTTRPAVVPGTGVRVYVPADASARAEGADHVAAALAAGECVGGESIALAVTSGEAEAEFILDQRCGDAATEVVEIVAAKGCLKFTAESRERRAAAGDVDETADGVSSIQRTERTAHEVNLLDVEQLQA